MNRRVTGMREAWRACVRALFGLTGEEQWALLIVLALALLGTVARVAHRSRLDRLGLHPQIQAPTANTRNGSGP